MNRRTFIIGLTGIIAAPAIIRASSLMPVRAWKPELKYVQHAWGHGTFGRAGGYYEAGEPIPMHSAVSIGTDGRIYLCNSPASLAGVVVPTPLPDDYRVSGGSLVLVRPPKPPLP
jgi:hypothetical protein